MSRDAPRHAIRRAVRHDRPYGLTRRARNRPGNGQQTVFWHGIGLPTKRTPHRLHQKPRSLRFAIHANPPKHPSACQNAVSWPKSDRIYVRPERSQPTRREKPRRRRARQSDRLSLCQRRLDGKNALPWQKITEIGRIGSCALPARRENTWSRSPLPAASDRDARVAALFFRFR